MRCHTSFGIGSALPRRFGAFAPAIASKMDVCLHSCLFFLVRSSFSRLILCFSRYSTGSYLLVSFLFPSSFPSSGDVLCLFFPGDSSSFASSAVRSTVSGLTIIEDALVKSEEPTPALDAPAIARLADLNPPRGFRSVPEAVEKPIAPAPPPRAGTAPGASFATAGGASGFGSGFGSAPAKPKTANEREEGDGSTWRRIGRGERSSGRGRPRAGATSWARGVAPANDRCPGSGLSFLGGMGAREIDSDPRTSSSPALAAVVTLHNSGLGVPDTRGVPENTAVRTRF